MDGNLKITENAEVTQEADLGWSVREGVIATIYDGYVWNASNVRELRRALENSTLNGHNDTIILEKGIYSTTSDGLGAFSVDDDEPYDLTIVSAEGLSYNDVILDGADTNQVLNIRNSTNDYVLYLDGISIRNGHSFDNGGGIYNSGDIKIQDCNISNNLIEEPGGPIHSGGGVYTEGRLSLYNSIVSNNFTYGNGGGFLSKKGADVIDSDIYDNIARYNSGGGFASYGGTTVVKDSEIWHNGAKIGFGGGFLSGGEIVVTDSKLHGNYSWNSSYGGGAIACTGDSDVTVTNSIMAYNYATGEGGGIYARGKVILNKSTLLGNKAKGNGGGLSSGLIVTANSLFQGNSASRGAISYTRQSMFAINNNFIGNSGSVYGKGSFINNIFDDNTQDIEFIGDSDLFNNYIDYTKLIEDGHQVLKRNNLQDVYDGSVFLEDDNKTLRANSPAINVGLHPNDTKFEESIINRQPDYVDDLYTEIKELLKTDFFGNGRIHESAIDIGASEYGSSK
jgi:predicted outer membrane repeat protein